MKKIRWGLLSTANINRRLIPAIRASKRGILNAVASRDFEKAKAYAGDWNIPLCFGSYEEMLTSGEVDAVYISLPNHLHAEWTIRALNAGIHVLCEKPFALKMDETDQMIRASRETGNYLAEAFMYRHHPQTKMTLEWIRAGTLGDITLMVGSFSFYMKNGAGNIRLTQDAGGGSLWDVGVYPLSFAQLVFGKIPEEVYGVQWLGSSNVDESFAGQMYYGNGQVAQISSSFRIPFQTAITIHGTKGRLEITRPFLNMHEGQMIFTPSEGDAQKIRVPKMDPYLGEVEDLHDAVLNHQPQLLTLEETRGHMRTALALYDSAQTGKLTRVS
jgi:D-xylose 1-dehydrogenase (NADP+, D-xylono-1,5-lactone-forming)